MLYFHSYFNGLITKTFAEVLYQIGNFVFENSAIPEHWDPLKILPIKVFIKQG